MPQRDQLGDLGTQFPHPIPQRTCCVGPGRALTARSMQVITFTSRRRCANSTFPARHQWVNRRSTREPCSNARAPHDRRWRRRAVSVRAYLPESEQVWLVDAEQNTLRAMRRVHPAGFYEALCPVGSANQNSQVSFACCFKSGEIIDMHDPYAVEPYLSDFDRFLFGEGRHWEIYNKLGAPTCARSMASAASTSLSGLPTRRAFKLSAISTAGMAVNT